jgi:hypothetical protein
MWFPLLLGRDAAVGATRHLSPLAPGGVGPLKLKMRAKPSKRSKPLKYF